MSINWRKTFVNSLLAASLAGNVFLGVQYLNKTIENVLGEDKYLIDARNVRGVTINPSPPIVGISSINPKSGIESMVSYYFIYPMGKMTKKDRVTYPAFPCRIINFNEDGFYSNEEESDAIIYPFGKRNDCDSEYIKGALQ